MCPLPPPSSPVPPATMGGSESRCASPPRSARSARVSRWCSTRAISSSEAASSRGHPGDGLDSFGLGVIRSSRLSLISQRLTAGEFTMRRVVGIAAFLVALLPAAAAAAGGEGGLINLDKSLIIQAINFLLLLFILSKILYRPLLAKMEERSQAIKKSLDEAQAARAEAQAQRAEHAARAEAPHAGPQPIRPTALHEAPEERRRLVEAARAEAARLVEGARAETE